MTVEEYIHELSSQIEILKTLPSNLLVGTIDYTTDDAPFFAETEPAIYSVQHIVKGNGFDLGDRTVRDPEDIEEARTNNLELFQAVVKE